MNVTRTVRGLVLLSLPVMLLACSDDNGHFCARYDYLYQQLQQPGLPSYGEMKESLLADIAKNGTNQKKNMLFVLEDFHLGIVPDGGDARETCMRLKRWEAYPFQ